MTGMSAKEQADAVIARIQQQRASLAFLQKRRNQFEADLIARRRRSSAEAQAKAKAQSDAAKMSFMMDVPSAPQTQRRPSKSAATAAADVDDDAKEANTSKPDDTTTNEGGMSFFMVPQTQRRSSRSLFKSGASSKDSKDRRSPPELERSPSFDWTKSRGSRGPTPSSSSGSRKKLPPKSKSLDDARKGAVGGELRRARRGAKRPQLKRNKTFGEADGNASYDWSSSRSLMSNASKDSEDNNKPRRASVAKPPTRLARSKSAGYKDKDGEEEQSVADLNASMSGPADFNWSMSGPADFDWNTSGTADFDWNTSGTADFDWNTGGTADFDWNKGGTADFSWVTNLTADFNWSVTKQLADVLANVKSTTEAGGAGEEEDNMMNNLDKLLENMQLECEALAKEQQQQAAAAPTTTTETQRVSTTKSKRSDDIASTSTHSTRSSMSSSPDHQWWKKQPVCQPAA